ncbi:MAG: MlaD family protein [Rikenellaceae bacterium]
MKREVKIGVFAVVVCCCAWAAARFFNGIDIFNKSTDYYVTYPTIDGIQSASPVMIKGVKVGSVTGILLKPEVGSSVKLQLSIKRDYEIPVDSRAKIVNNGLMGGKVVYINLGDSNTLVESNGVIPAVTEPDIFELAGSEFMDVKEQFVDMSKELTLTLKGINALLEANNKSINSTLEHLSGITATLDELLASEQSNIQRAVGGFATLGETLSGSSQRIDSIFVNVNALTTQLNEANIAGSLECTLTGVNNLVERLNSKEGSISKVLYDDALYDNLASASLNLSTLLGDLQVRPSRYVHFSLFGRKEQKKMRKAQERAHKDSIKMAKDR